MGLAAAFQRASIMASEREEQRVEVARMVMAARADKAEEVQSMTQRV